MRVCEVDAANKFCVTSIAVFKPHFICAMLGYTDLLLTAETNGGLQFVAFPEDDQSRQQSDSVAQIERFATSGHHLTITPCDNLRLHVIEPAKRFTSNPPGFP